MLSQLSHCICSHNSEEGKGPVLVSLSWRRENFPYVSHFFQLPMLESLLFPELWWEGKKGAAPRPCLRLAEAELVEGLVNNPHRIIHNLYYKDTEYSLDSF